VAHLRVDHVHGQGNDVFWAAGAPRVAPARTIGARVHHPSGGHAVRHAVTPLIALRNMRQPEFRMELPSASTADKPGR